MCSPSPANRIRDTNSVWYESIPRHGLGGRNVICESRVIELFAELLDSSYAASIPRGIHHVSAEVIAAQKVVSTGWNLRHGGDVRGVWVA